MRVFYLENNPATSVVAYPYTIRGNGSNQYINNIGLPNSYNGVDFQGAYNSHCIRKLMGCIFNDDIRVGPNTMGWIEGVLTNGNAVARVGYNISGWVTENNIFSQVINPVTKVHERLIIVVGSNEKIMNCFAYGFVYWFTYRFWLCRSI